MCHHTSSNSNPWVQICIAEAAVQTHLAENNLDCIGPCPCGARLDNATASSDFAMAVYPNPSASQINVEFESETSGTFELAVFDITGRIVLNNSGNVNEGGNRIGVPVEGLAEGVYNLRVTIANEMASVRLIISK